MKKLISVLLAVLMVFSVVYPLTGFANEFTFTDMKNAGVHDPSIYKAKDGKYYIVGSHMVMYDSDDMINWNQKESSLDAKGYLGDDWKVTLAEPLKWTTSWQEWRKSVDPNFAETPIEYNCWANDIIYNEAMGKYCLYGAVSVWGATCSVIWLCTSDNIEGPYEYVHSFIYTGITRNTSSNSPRYNGLPYTATNVQTDLIDTKLLTRDQALAMPWFIQDKNAWNFGHYACGLGEYPNAIDPAPFVDKNGDMWLVYGSYSGGCFVIKLDKETGLPDYKYMKDADGYDIYYGKRVSNTNLGSEATGEGPYIQYDPVSDYYYFFLTYGGLYEGGGYSVYEYRSKTPDGPYFDTKGNPATIMDNSGLKLDPNYKFSSQKTAMLSGGHSSCLVDDDNSMYQVYHQRYLGFGGAFNSVIHKMARTENGWSVLLPFQYQGEKDIESVSKDDVVGVYEFVDSTDKIHNLYGNNFEDIVAPTQTIALNADGTISNIKSVDYKIVQENGKDIKRFVMNDAVGTWELKDETTYVNFKINDVNYSGVFAKQFDETEKKNEVLVFSAAGDNNTSIWGVKDNSHSLKFDKSIDATCKANGYDVYSCDDCDIVLIMNLKNKLEHSYEMTVTKNADCVNKGVETYKCRNCDDSYTRDIEATGHNYQSKVVNASCYQAGYTTHTCTICADYYIDSNTKPTGKHTYSATGKVTTKATYAKAGVKTFTCTTKGCTAKKTQSISKLTLAKPTSVKASALSKSFNLSWKKVSASKGYEIQYSTSSKFTSPKKITISKNSTVSTSVKKLKSKKKYYVRIRAYVTENGKKYYSSWVSTSITTKK